MHLLNAESRLRRGMAERERFRPSQTQGPRCGSLSGFESGPELPIGSS